jgi:hypothetical protein
MANHPILNNTPIREIIFTISYSEAVDLEKLKLFIQQEDISKKFTSIRDGFNTQLIATEGQKPMATLPNFPIIDKEAIKTLLVTLRMFFLISKPMKNKKYMKARLFAL